MGKKSRPAAGHSGQTDSGNTKDVKVERVGPVTIYKRGLAYYLYYREAGTSHRQKVEGNLAVARATASKVASALADGRPSPIGHKRTSPQELVAGYLAYITDVRSLALRTQDRYRAALDRFLGFCQDAGIGAVDAIDVGTVEDFVKWLRGQTRARNGASKGKREVYKTGGIKFILSTCRTAMNWAGRRRMLPPFAENPFTSFPIDGLRDRDSRDGERVIFAPAQEAAFFAACSEWQWAIFVTLATYGLRVGELTHLLVEDVDFAASSFRIRSKPEQFWNVKTGRSRELPLVPKTRAIFDRLIGERKAGFVFLREDFASGKVRPPHGFATPEAMLAQLRKVVATTVAAKPEAGERDKRRDVMAFCRSMGQIPEKRIREEFMKLTARIGCPEYTRAHDLRHLFSSRAQEAGMNPLLVQEMLGHATLDMTRRYTHLGLEAKRDAMGKIGATGDDSKAEAGLVEDLPGRRGRDLGKAVGRRSERLPQGRERPVGRAVGLGRWQSPGLAEDPLAGRMVVDARLAPDMAWGQGDQPFEVEAGDPVGDGIAGTATGGAGGLLLIVAVGEGQEHRDAGDLDGGLGRGPADPHQRPALEVGERAVGSFSRRDMKASV